MTAKAKYTIGGEAFTTKDAITARCRQIRDEVPDGNFVAAGSKLSFLLDLFSTWHDEWDDKLLAALSASPL